MPTRRWAASRSAWSCVTRLASSATREDRAATMSLEVFTRPSANVDRLSSSPLPACGPSVHNSEVAKKDKKAKDQEPPDDLAARIGARPEPPPAPPPAPPQKAPPSPARLDAPLPPRRSEERPREERSRAATPAPASKSQPQDPNSMEWPSPIPPIDERIEPAIPSTRTPPGPGETDLVVTPLPTPDDWHRFELALRRVRGVGQLRTEYYRHGVLKVRVSYQGTDRLATALRAGVTGYRVRVIGEDRATLQILVTSEGDERRPG